MNRMYWWLWIRVGKGVQAVSKLAWWFVLAGEHSYSYTIDRRQALLCLCLPRSSQLREWGTWSREEGSGGGLTFVHTAYRYSPFSGLVRPSGRPRPGRPQALAEHWQGRTGLSRGSKSCNMVSVGELGEDPPTRFWARKFAPYAALGV